MKDYSKNIHLNNIVYNSVCNNKILGVSIILLLAGYGFQDIIFSRVFGKILSDIPEFTQTLDYSKILGVFFPYLIAYFFFYIDDLILANIFPKMEINIIHQLL